MSPRVKLFLFFVPLFLLGLCAKAQQDKYRYLILFKDKANSPFSISKPDQFLSSRSIERRKKMNIVINEQDLPINPAYLEQLKANGATVLFPLKWINGALIQLKPKDLSKTLKLSNVKGLYWNFPADSSSSFKISNNPEVRTDAQMNTKTDAQSAIDYGNSSTQILQLGIDQMHLKGYQGQNVIISILDNGFLNANTASFFQNLYQSQRVLGTLVTKPTIKSVYEIGSHGTSVMSTITGETPGKLYGTAYQAKFAIAQTEEDDIELIVEEANWLRGAEWADSLGTDIISSSLGYSQFDNSLQNHAYADMNGKNTLVSKAASWASQKGIICTISAGNEGSNTWKYISAPADADSILSVGAVDRTGIRASFSSFGPSFDKRIKPDVSAMGLGTVVGLPTGLFGSLNGTSFSAPLIAGLVAGLIQANPNKSAWKIIDAIKKSAHLADKPDNSLGYGIPNFDKANAILNPILGTEPKFSSKLTIYPNPIKTGEKINIDQEKDKNSTLEIFNTQGILISTFDLHQEHEEIFLPPFASGKYYFRFTIGKEYRVIPMLLNP